MVRTVDRMRRIFASAYGIGSTAVILEPPSLVRGQIGPCSVNDNRQAAREVCSVIGRAEPAVRAAVAMGLAARW
jgi:hypothetical protein